MKATKLIKRAFSLVLCMVMLVSCWVFTAPQAEAAGGNLTAVTDDENNWRVRVLICEVNDFGTNANGTYSAGTTTQASSTKPSSISTSYCRITYKSLNGTGTANYLFFNLGDKDAKGRTDCISGGGHNYGYFPSDTGYSIKGFPTAMYTTIYKNSGIGYTAGTYHAYLQVGKLVDGSWDWANMGGTCDKSQKDIANDSTKNYKQGILDYECTGTGWTNIYSSGTVGGKKFPDWKNSCTASYAESTVTVPKSGTVDNLISFSKDVKDQYGVTMACKITVNCATQTTGITHAGKTTTVATDAHIEGSTNSQTITASIEWPEDSGTGYTKLTRSCSFTLNDETYAVKYVSYVTTITDNTLTTMPENPPEKYNPYGIQSGVLFHQDDVPYGDTAPAPPSPTADIIYYYGSTKHWVQNSAWTKPTPTGGIKMDYTQSLNDYNSTGYSHEWSENWEQFTGTYHGYGASNFHRKKCTVDCDKLVNNEHIAEHYIFAWHVYDQTTVQDDTTVLVAPTCTTAGKYVKTCICGKVDPTRNKTYPNQSTSTRNKTAYTVDATGHTPVTDAAEEATCQHSGLTEGSHCSVCDTVLTAQSVIPQLDHNYSEQSTTYPKTAPACGVDGVYYLTCTMCHQPGTAFYTKEGTALEHNWGTEPHRADLADGEEGYVYYSCLNGCGKFCAAKLVENEETGVYEYAADEDHMEESPASVAGESVAVPYPVFNSDQNGAQFYGSGLKYFERKSSFKYEQLTVNGITTQTMRFAGSVKVPSTTDGTVKIGLTNTEGINNVIDFGFVYTQERYIMTDSTFPDPITGDPVPYSYADPTKLVYDADNKGTPGELGYKIEKMSVAANNSGTDITRWTNGVSTHGLAGDMYLTFNLVIPIKKSNWGRNYAARPYITYNYNGQEITLYDTGRTAMDKEYLNSDGEEHTFYNRSVAGLAAKIMGVRVVGESDSLLYDYTQAKVAYSDFMNVAASYNRDKAYVLNNIILPFESYCYNYDGREQSYFYNFKYNIYALEDKTLTELVTANSPTGTAEQKAAFHADLENYFTWQSQEYIDSVLPTITESYYRSLMPS